MEYISGQIPMHNTQFTVIFLKYIYFICLRQLVILSVVRVPLNKLSLM